VDGCRQNIFGVTVRETSNNCNLHLGFWGLHQSIWLRFAMSGKLWALLYKQGCQTMWIQKEITLKARPRGFHLVTDEILGQLPEFKGIKIGLMNVFIKHTSVSLTINENAALEVGWTLKASSTTPCRKTNRITAT
jgi:Uncharacterised protein family UPF0047